LNFIRFADIHCLVSLIQFDKAACAMRCSIPSRVGLKILCCWGSST
jgi:hypothetical protein